MLFTLAMFPIGAGTSLRKPVAEVIEEIDRAGLHYQAGPADTVIEGDWETVMPVIRRAEERMRATNARVFTVLTIDDHVGAENRLHEAVADVARELHHEIRH